MSLKGKIIKELSKRPHRLKELKAKLGNDKRLAKQMDAMVASHEVSQRSGGVYLLNRANSKNAIECTIIKLAKGFGFAQPVTGSADVFIPGKALLGAMPGDTVLVEISKNPRIEASQEGEVVSVLKENNRFTGTVEKIDGKLFLIPDACPAVPIYIKKSAIGGATPGEKVAVEILDRGMNQKDHRSGVSVRFGSADLAKNCAKSILYSEGITKQFPAKVKTQAKEIPVTQLDEKELETRKDYRDEIIFTIDAASTKDIDDAISIQRTEQGYKLGVHIADVSYYVKQGTSLDEEALRRATSVYYADEVVPMLPRQLSNGICSLNEGVDRFAFSCMMELDAQANVVDYSFVKSVICSKVKGVYSELNDLLAQKAEESVVQKYTEIAPALPVLQEVYQKLAQKRETRGALEIESGEAKLLIDDAGICVGIEKRERGETECMIEEFMLLANSCAANLARKMELPFVYRVHSAPDPARIDALKTTLQAAGVMCKFEKDTPTTKEFAQLLQTTKGTNLERPVHTNVLRSMAKAVYAPQPEGHFGLALEDYAHFTSPIRRYPDLAIHRILTDVCAKVPAEKIKKKYESFAAEASAQSSARELSAMRAERDIEACYKAEFMRDKVGQEFEGVVSSVTSFGLYVELADTVEGLVRVQTLSEHGLTLTQGVSLRDPVAGKVWRLGDAMRVRLTAVEVSTGNLDFEPVV